MIWKLQFIYGRPQISGMRGSNGGFMYLKQNWHVQQVWMVIIFAYLHRKPQMQPHLQEVSYQSRIDLRVTVRNPLQTLSARMPWHLSDLVCARRMIPVS